MKLWSRLKKNKTRSSIAYLCGPMPFMAEQQKALIARGVPAENIHSEAFGTGGVHH
jgi:ferredoxin-NADP reductase